MQPSFAYDRGRLHGLAMSRLCYRSYRSAFALSRHARPLRWMNGESRASVVCRDLSGEFFGSVLMSSAYPDLHDLCAPWYFIGLAAFHISKCKVASFGHWCCHHGANCNIRVWFRISSCHLDHLVFRATGFFKHPTLCNFYAISMHIFACFCMFLHVFAYVFPLPWICDDI